MQYSAVRELYSEKLVCGLYFSLALALLLLMPSFAKAEVSDKAQMFSPAAIANANRVIDEIRASTRPS